jgi:hypothetical protein
MTDGWRFVFLLAAVALAVIAAVRTPVIVRRRRDDATTAFGLNLFPLAFALFVFPTLWDTAERL